MGVNATMGSLKHIKCNPNLPPCEIKVLVNWLDVTHQEEESQSPQTTMQSEHVQSHKVIRDYAVCITHRCSEVQRGDEL